MRTLAALFVVLVGVSCVWASAGEEEGEAVTNDFVSAPDAVVHPRVVQNLAVLSTNPRNLIKARTVAHLPSHGATDASESTEQLEQVPAEMELVDTMTLDAAEESRFAEADIAGEADAAPAAAAAAVSSAGAAPGLPPPRPVGVSVDATAPTPPQPKPVAKKGKGKAAAEEEVQRVAVGTLDGPVQRHGDKPDAILESVKDILAVPEKDGLPAGNMKTTKAVGAASCGKGCQRKLPVMVGWSGLNERPAHKNGRRVILPGDHARTRARHEALKVPDKYSWAQRHLNQARAHLKKAAKRIRDLRSARKKIGDAPLAVPVVV